MNISLPSPYLSLNNFQTAGLPKFMVVTGVNGAGKTHLLKALSEGKARVDVCTDFKNDVKFYDWSKLVPNNTGKYATSTLYQKRDSILQWGEQARLKNREQMFQWQSKYCDHHDLESVWDLLRLDENELTKYVKPGEDVSTAYRDLRKVQVAASQLIQQNINSTKDLETKQLVAKVRANDGSNLVSLRSSDFTDDAFGWGTVNIFQQSFAQLFLGYFEKQRLNRLRLLDKQEGRVPVVEPVSEEKFEQINGKPPWEFVNQALETAKLDFKIDHPTGYATTSFTPQLRKISSGAELQFSELSSGERVLMSFAFCLYHSDDKRQNVVHPKLLLFDEIDATLHPSMARRLIDTIKSSLIDDLNIHVILTTHSPSTAAVAKEEAIYVMRPGEAGLIKTTKRQAISVLTSEIPTLSIDFEGRRQVFVESKNDARLFSGLYKEVDQLLQTERSIEFIPVGSSSADGDTGSGCGQVERIVTSLSNSGNKTVFGLLDWDLKNKPTDRVFVLAEGRRYAIENCLLDPLLVATLLTREDPHWRNACGIDRVLKYSSLRNKKPEELQELIHLVEKKIIDTSDASMIECNYVGRFKCSVSQTYLQRNGHNLEDNLREAFPKLKRFHQDGKILTEMVNTIIPDYLEFLPIEIVDAFNSVLKANL